ncbi:putative polypeptide N-acetylgalactosaminyltransferase 10 [Amyelois transitella]|uniref:putative polypeptide N-acetylgalactosaminyltransferase 10 n=1 Tax=Amyelois transitella TaxID=680683 RepID=UPI00298FA477|nr:putative polypeptide N-acetylgalactosaminyltransferase 10 [Amyelois transitella]
MLIQMLKSMNSYRGAMGSFANEQSIKDLLAKNDCFIPKSLRRIDWHDHDLIKKERKRKGFGERGQPAKLTNLDDIFEAAGRFQIYGLNAKVSDNISLSRSLPDTRNAACMNKMYIESLPSVSIIIPFHNEHQSTLLRTICSVTNRTPHKLIKEIIIVDDANDIDANTFEYKSNGEYYGGFDWHLNFKLYPLIEEDRLKLPEPYANPVMSGGIFAISRLFFWELGGYDPGLYAWGGEQFELSFKIWLCGGRMFTAPCSRVGHVYRDPPRYLKYGYGDFLRRNYRRVADVWMDSYAAKLYSSDTVYSRIDPGDISQQQAFRQRRHCKSFDWFINEIVNDMRTQSDAYIDKFNLAEGQVRPLWSQSLCVHADYDTRQLVMKKCQEWRKNEQTFFFTYRRDVQNKDMCWDLRESAPMSPVLLDICSGLGGNQLWRYDVDSLQIIQGIGNCLEWDELSQSSLHINRCVNYSSAQKWQVDYNTFHLI